MPKATKTVAGLKVGERGVICCFSDQEMSLKLLEMGCLPGSEIELTSKAPFGDPVCIKVLGYNLSLRLDEAATIKLI
ncbi:MAG TPA: FeoA family protein [Cytophagaceae bacterium]|jgi:ferrous iron transport protein A|nr:FeoA family protein [Cytophagaceae bacterium]